MLTDIHDRPPPFLAPAEYDKVRRPPVCQGALDGLEKYVRDGNVAGFLEDDSALEFWLDCLYRFALPASGRKREAVKRMGNASDEASLNDFVNSNDMAFVLLVLVNNNKGWTDRKLAPPDSDIHKKCIGRWTAVDIGTSGVGEKRKQHTCASGWHKDGLEFHQLAQVFFKLFRAHEDHAKFVVKMEEREYNLYTAPKIAALERRKRKRPVLRTEMNVCADFSEWANEGDRVFGMVGV